MNARKIKIGRTYCFKGGSSRFVFIGFNVMDLFHPLYEFEIIDTKEKFWLDNVKRIKECL